MRRATGSDLTRHHRYAHKFRLLIPLVLLVAAPVSFALAGVPGAVTKLVSQEQKPPGWVAPGPPFKASKVKGKTFFYLSIFKTNPIEGQEIEGLKEATEAVGAKLTVFDGKGQVSEEARGISQAINQKVAAIILGSVSPSLIEGPLADAKKAGIPVIASRTQDPGNPLPEAKSVGVVGIATHSFSRAGKMLGDFTIADSHGKADAAIFISSDVGIPSQLELKAIEGEYKKYCPSCKYHVFDFPVAQWTTLTSRLPSILRANPTINYLIPEYDNMTLYITPALEQAKLNLPIATFNGTPAIMQLMKKHSYVTADVGSADLRQGWAMADQAFRIVAGYPQAVGEFVPERLFTRGNISSVNLDKPDDQTWYAGGDWRGKYMELWGQK